MDKIAAFEKEWWEESKYVSAHTSGSTGKPKHISLLKSDMVRSAEATNSFFGLDKDSVLVCPLSIDYIAGKMMYVRGAVAGCKVVFEEPSMKPLEKWEGGRISLLAIVPAQIPGFIESGKADLVDNVIVGGGVVSPLLESQLLRAVANSYVTYGMTETCSHVAIRKMGGESRRYRGLPGYRFSLSEKSTLIIENREMSFGSLVTNDCVKLLSDNEFLLLGRADNVIVSGGVKIHPEEIEAEIADLMCGRDYMISARRGDLWGEECVLVLEGSERIIDENGLLEEIKGRLGKYKYPKRIEYVEQFKRTESGKIVRGGVKL